jgi:hypothetical protein
VKEITSLPSSSFGATVALVSAANAAGEPVFGMVLGKKVTARPGDCPHHLYDAQGFYPAQHRTCCDAPK